MNISITEGLNLMPPQFVDGLAQWSSENGTSGSATYDGSANAAYVPSDQDFSGCLELLKTEATQKLRWTGQTPILPGTYLRITAKVKAMSGIFPDVRIAGYPMDGSDTHVSGLTEVGQTVSLDTYGKVVEVSAIVGTGDRPGVDMVWGADAEYGHFGLDLVGSSGGIVRIDDIIIEDVTSAFLREMFDVVDVRDFGAVGDGTTDDYQAFVDAEAAADGRTIIVPEGTYYIGTTLSLASKVRFEGTITMPPEARLVLLRNFDQEHYADAFGDEVEGFKRGFQALMNFSDHDSFDLCGRSIELSGPIDMQGALNTADYFLIRRAIRNGIFTALDDPAWDPDVVTSSGTYNPNNPGQLTNVTNASQIQPGSQITGNGVGREIFVKSVNVAAQTLELSAALYGPNTTQSYTFTRYKYMFDFVGFENLRRLTFSDVEWQGNGHANAVLLPKEGENIIFKDCFFLKPANKGITSPGRGCQDLHVDRCQFISSEQGTAATARESVAFNVNANDTKIRNNRFQRMGLSMVLNGTGHIVTGNHIFQGDDETNAPRLAGILFVSLSAVTNVTGNYLDNCSIEWTNEYDATPDYGTEYGFGGLTITGNIFFCSNAIASFRYIRVKPYGTGHFLDGVHVNQNVFYAINGAIDRVEEWDETFAPADYWRFRNVTFERNTFNNIAQRTMSPVSLEFSQSTKASTWTCDPSEYLPFGGNARNVTALVAEGEITDNSNDPLYTMPYVLPNAGSNNKQVQLKWSKNCSGKVLVTTRVDNPW